MRRCDASIVEGSCACAAEDLVEAVEVAAAEWFDASSADHRSGEELSVDSACVSCSCESVVSSLTARPIADDGLVVCNVVTLVGPIVAACKSACLGDSVCSSCEAVGGGCMCRSSLPAWCCLVLCPLTGGCALISVDFAYGWLVWYWRLRRDLIVLMVVPCLLFRLAC